MSDGSSVAAYFFFVNHVIVAVYGVSEQSEVVPRKRMNFVIIFTQIIWKEKERNRMWSLGKAKYLSTIY